MICMQKSYIPECWVCVGPRLLTDAAISVTGTRRVSGIPASSMVTVITDTIMMTVNHRQSRDMLFPIKPVSMRYRRHCHSNVL